MNLNSIIIVISLSFFSSSLFAQECVVLLHGLARTSASMNKLEMAISKAGYVVANIDYPSRTRPIEELAELAVKKGLAQCQQLKAKPVNFVTHSLGGILVRQYYKKHKPANVKRVVMLGPPNKGSEIVDNLKDVMGFELLMGPAGKQLGTSKQDVPKRLGPVNFELGVIAGTNSINLLLSSYLPDPDDGAVSIESAKIEGMRGFVALPVTHLFMMRNDRVIKQVIHFLLQGRFLN